MLLFLNLFMTQHTGVLRQINNIKIVGLKKLQLFKEREFCVRVTRNIMMSMMERLLCSLPI
jgi:phage regulator Rha-like protein